VRPYASELDELVATSLGVLVEQEAIAGDRRLQSLQLVSPHHGLSGEETMDKEKKARRVFEGGVSVGSDIESFQSLAKANPNRCTFDTNRDLEKVAGVRGGGWFLTLFCTAEDSARLQSQATPVCLVAFLTLLWFFLSPALSL
jgi:hypothetical protein